MSIIAYVLYFFLIVKHLIYVNFLVLYAGIFSLAFAVVPSEDKENWIWFLRQLRDVLDTDRKFTFVSDRNYGLLEGINTVFADHFHSYCMFHLKLNLFDNCRGMPSSVKQRLLYMFRECAYAPNAMQFHEKMNVLLKEGGDNIKHFLKDLEPCHYANAIL